MDLLFRWSLSGALLVAGCSVTGPRRTACSGDDACRDAFGLDHVCKADGYCEPVSHPRCDRTHPEDLFTAPERYRDAIVFGSLQDLSLETKRARERAVRLAVTQANEAGGLDGRPFGLVLCTLEEDASIDPSSQEQATAATARFLAESLDVPALIGPSSSPLVQEAFLELDGTGTLIMSPSASSPALTTLETSLPGLLWRSTPPDSLQGTAIAQDMWTPGPGRDGPSETVAVVHETGAYGTGLAEVFGAGFGAAGGQVSLHAFDDNAAMGAAFNAAAARAPDEVLLVAQTATLVTMTITAVGTDALDDSLLFVSDTGANADFTSQVDTSVFARLRGSRPAPADPSQATYTSFQTAYLAEWGEDPFMHSFTAQSYDAAWLVMYASAWALQQEGGIDGARLGLGLRQVSAGAPVDVDVKGWAQVVAAFAQGQGVDVNGVSGSLDFDPVTEEVSGPVEIWVVEQGQITGIDTWLP